MVNSVMKKVDTIAFSIWGVLRLAHDVQFSPVLVVIYLPSVLVVCVGVFSSSVVQLFSPT